MRCLQLPFRFNPDRLRAELARVDAAEWIPHQQRRHYDGQWSGAALRSIGGVALNIVPDAQGAEVFQGTPLLGRCAYFQDVLATFPCPLQAARLLRLHAGSNIAEHIDHALDFEEGEVRLHIPIVTSDDVKLYLDGSRLIMAPGECWYTNVNLPHSVENRGATDRIHLVIDCRVDDWLRQVFAANPRPAVDHYAARLKLTAAPPPTALLEFLAANAVPGAKLTAERRTLILTWAGPHSWQFRLKLPQLERPWCAELESSPDPERTHRKDYDLLLHRFAQAFPDAEVVHEGIA
jgi:hypothetical protein